MPSNFAGHGMPCPYKTESDRRVGAERAARCQVTLPGVFRRGGLRPYEFPVNPKPGYGWSGISVISDWAWTFPT